jgi:hypothetical protein
MARRMYRTHTQTNMSLGSRFTEFFSPGSSKETRGALKAALAEHESHTARGSPADALAHLHDQLLLPELNAPVQEAFRLQSQIEQETKRLQAQVARLHTHATARVLPACQRLNQALLALGDISHSLSMVEEELADLGLVEGPLNTRS